MLYSKEEISTFKTNWDNFYRINNERGVACKAQLDGYQWDPAYVRTRNELGEDSLSVNLMQLYSQILKGEADKLELSLKINCNVKGDILTAGKAILNRFILHNENLKAFKEVLHNVYDYGYGALHVGYKNFGIDKPYYEPFLNVIKDSCRVFFDIDAPNLFKTEGRFCGIYYKMAGRDLAKKDQTFICKKLGCSAHNTINKNFEITDFWYREPVEVTWYFYQSTGDWTKNKLSNEKPYMERDVRSYQVKFMRLIDNYVLQEPVDYLTNNKLPIVFWPGVISCNYSLYGGEKVENTFPYVHNLIDSQILVNACVSSISSRLKKAGGKKVVTTKDIIQGKEEQWQDFNRSAGIFYTNPNSENQFTPPLILNEDPLDATVFNSLQVILSLFDKMSGINLAQKGENQASGPNVSRLKQIMQGSVAQSSILNNHLDAINEVGAIIKQMLPKIVIEQRELENGIVLNKKGNTHAPSAPVIRNDIRQICSKIDCVIEYNVNSEAEKTYNAVIISDLIKSSPNIAPYLLDVLVKNLNISDRDDILARVKALMPEGIVEVGDGSKSIEEYRQEQRQSQQNQPPSIEQQKLDLEKEALASNTQLKQTDQQIKAAKLQNQTIKDKENLDIKKYSAMTKNEPKEMIYDNITKK